MKRMQDDILKVLLSEEQIAEKVAQTGRQITEDYQDKNLLMVSVLKGSVVQSLLSSFLIRLMILTDQE